MRRKLLGFAFGFAAVVALAVVLRSGPAAPTVVLSECDGRIRTVGIQFTREAAPTTWPTLRAFFDHLADDVEVLALCGDQADADAFRAAAADLPQRRVQTAVVGAPITGWSKDRFLVAGSTLLLPRREASSLGTRTNDSRVGPTLEKRWPDRFRAVESSLVFDAGDLLCAGSRVLVNDEIPRKNPAARDWLARVESLTGRRPLWLRGSPDHHIGTFAAPLDDATVVVGDPDLGHRLWTPEAGRLLGEPDWSEVAMAPFRRSIATLKAAGYRIVRTPLAVIGPKVFVTYTNGVFEKRDGKHLVYAPAYGVAALDAAAVEAYRSVGWDARPVPVEGVFRNCGTIGCLVNVLERG